MKIPRFELEQIAADTQQLFERRAIPHDFLMGLLMAQFPAAQQPEEEICRWVQKAVKRFPRDNCVLASLALNHRLDQQGRLVEGLYKDKKVIHTILDVGIVEEEQTVVDITGHQYRNGFRRGPKLYVGPPLDTEMWLPLKYFSPIELPLPIHEQHVEPSRFSLLHAAFDPPSSL